MSSAQIEYTVRVHQEDGSFWAEVVDLPGCFASGHTLDELREGLEEAIALCRDESGSEDPAASKGQLEVGEMRVSVPA
jgi:predicted RNase H-like HicB family nuclease